RGKTFVVKCGGEAVESGADTKQLLEQISVLTQLGIRVVLVHGGGPQATQLATRLSAQSTFVEGRRVTDPAMLEAMVMALNGTARSQILSTCRELDIPAIGLSGVDAGLVRAERKPPVKLASGETVDYGLVGKILTVNVNSVNDLLDDGYLPIVSPLSADDNGQILNINADHVAAAIAIALNAVKLVMITGARGVLRDASDPTSLISQTDLSELQKLEEQGILKDGMLPKKTAIAEALNGGVNRVHVVSYRYTDSLLTEVFTNEGCGTMITRDDDEGAEN
ncbi:MAG: acetylglutamate kinase, partial [Armatimonadetes bacterium]|nr:acetylglutamate kinase [Armatimonadota bacterium]